MTQSQVGAGAVPRLSVSFDGMPMFSDAGFLYDAFDEAEEDYIHNGFLR